MAILGLIEFVDKQALRKEGQSLFSNIDAKNIAPETSRTQVLQGFIEQSNVNALSEMTELIKAHRQFEGIQRVIKTYDQIAGKGINEIAKF